MVDLSPDTEVWNRTLLLEQCMANDREEGRKRRGWTVQPRSLDWKPFMR